jgi:RNA recognition motif-containing protein
MAETSVALAYDHGFRVSGRTCDRQEIAMGKKLYVGNLSYDITSSDLEAMLSAHGTVISAEVISDRATGRSKGFGFVEMESAEEADAAIAALNGQSHEGRTLTVNEARPRAPRTGAGGGGRGGYGGGGGRRDRY